MGCGSVSDLQINKIHYKIDRACFNSVSVLFSDYGTYCNSFIISIRHLLKKEKE